jgi:hypothetical protein
MEILINNPEKLFDIDYFYGIFSGSSVDNTSLQVLPFEMTARICFHSHKVKSIQHRFQFMKTNIFRIVAKLGKESM